MEAKLGKKNAEGLEEAIALTKKFLPKAQSLLARNGSSLGEGFLFGPDPTVLDAHVLVFFCRLHDLDRTDWFPPGVLEWVRRFRDGPVWHEVVPSLRTLPPALQ